MTGYDARFTPMLTLRKTISHPLEEVRVIGFEGRDPVYGRNAVVLKREEVPEMQIREGDYRKTVIAIPEQAWMQIDHEGYALYVLDVSRVLAIQLDDDVDAEKRTFETHYGDVHFMSLKLESFESYPREHVEVSLP